jgi:hypothetical protein
MVAAMVLGGLSRYEVLGLRLEDLRVAERRVFMLKAGAGTSGWSRSHHLFGLSARRGWTGNRFVEQPQHWLERVTLRG